MGGCSTTWRIHLPITQEAAGPEGRAVMVPDLLGALAEAHYRAGHPDDAFACVEQMLGVAGEEHVDVSEHMDVNVLKVVLEGAGVPVEALLGEAS